MPRSLLARLTLWFAVTAMLLITLVGLPEAARAESFPSIPETGLAVTVNLTSHSGIGEPVGVVQLADSDYGLLITPQLSGLPPGIHGLHIHANPACGPAEKEGRVVPGLAAGGHFDPQATGHHEGPYQAGHLGDLPPLYVDDQGSATTPILAPRLTLQQVVDHALMIHQGGDNFSDTPSPLGGGGPRLACGVIATAP